jgi:hypothetical protein
MENVASDESLRSLVLHHRSLKDYRCGRSIQLVLSSLVRLRRRARTFGCKSQDFFMRLETLRKLIKKQDAAFNSLPDDGSFSVKASIHRKNSQLWTQQALELTMEFLGNLTTVDAITAPDAGRYVAEHQASVAKQKALPFDHVSDYSDDEDD